MILERYIRREVLENLIWIIGFLVLILTSHRFVDYLSEAAAGKLPGDLILNILLMKILAIVPRILPIALFLAVILALTRLSRDKELTIMSGAGLAGGFQFLTVFKLSLVYALIVFGISFYASPWAEGKVQALKNRAKQESDITGISAGQFKEFSSGDRVVYIEGLSDNGDMENVFLQVRQDRNLGVLNSDRAKYIYREGSGSRYVLFENGRRYVGTPGMLDYRITEYRHYAVLMEQPGQGDITAELESLPSHELIGSDLPRHHAELQWRLSYVLASLLLPLLAVALNGLSIGEKRYLFVIVSILIYLIYSNLLGISKTLLMRDDIPASVGLWWGHLLMAIAIIVIFKIQASSYRRRRAGSQKLPTPVP